MELNVLITNNLEQQTITLGVKKTRSNRNNIFNLCVLCKRLQSFLRLLLVFILCIYRVAVRVL